MMANPARSSAFGYGRELRDDVLAVPALLQHAGDSGQLALGALEPVDHGRQFCGIEFQGFLQRSVACPQFYTP